MVSPVVARTPVAHGTCELPSRCRQPARGYRAAGGHRLPHFPGALRLLDRPRAGMGWRVTTRKAHVRKAVDEDRSLDCPQYLGRNPLNALEVRTAAHASV